MDFADEMRVLDEAAEMRSLLTESAATLHELADRIAASAAKFAALMIERESLYSKILAYENGLVVPGDPDYDEEVASWICTQKSTASSSVKSSV